MKKQDLKSNKKASVLPKGDTERKRESSIGVENLVNLMKKAPVVPQQIRDWEAKR